MLRRLSRLEYELTLKSLLRLPDTFEAAGIPKEAELDNFTTLAELQTLSAQHLRGYMDTAIAESSALMQDVTRRDAVIGCSTQAPECLADFVARFGAVAYRRALAADDVAAIVSRVSQSELDPDDQFQFAIELLLTSPNFIYRVEVGDLPEGKSTLTAEELASRLSFAVWGTGPSSELLQRARTGELGTSEGLNAVATEMLLDPRAKSFFGHFFSEWLAFGELKLPEARPEGWKDSLLPDLLDETQSLLEEYAWGSANFLDSLTANHSYVSADLAAFYNLGTPENGRVEFPVDHPRYASGLLTHPTLISAKSDGDPVAVRGHWLRKTFLCDHLELPPGLLDSLGDELVGLSPVEIVKKRNAEPTCAGCHVQIDPIGVGYLKFDGQGRYDDSVDLAPYGITPALPGSDAAGFNTMAELASQLKQMPGVAECVTDRVFLYVHGRSSRAGDACTTGAVSGAFQGTNHRFETLISALVADPSFRFRYAPQGVDAP